MPVPKGMWAIPVTIGVTADEKQLVESTMRTAIAKLGPGIDQMEVNVTNVTGEWQGVKYIPNAKSQRWSHEDQFAELCRHYGWACGAILTWRTVYYGRA